MGTSQQTLKVVSRNRLISWELFQRTVFAFGLAAAAVAGAPAAARAADCPEVAPDDAVERRNLAKTWFSKAENAETSGDDQAAIKAYECSLKLAPHAATAYNLARVSEKAGDLDMALHAYRNYLTLKPQAPDREEV